MHVFNPMARRLLDQTVKFHDPAIYPHIAFALIRVLTPTKFDFADRKNDADMTTLTPMLMTASGSPIVITMASLGGVLSLRAGAANPLINIDRIVTFTALTPDSGQVVDQAIAYFLGTAPNGLANMPIWTRDLPDRDPLGQNYSINMTAAAGNAFLSALS